MKYATFFISALIIIAVLIPGPNLPDVSIGGFDKLVHVGMFFLWAFAVRYDIDRRPFPWLKTFIAGLLFSGLTEVLQLVVEGRTYDVYDMAADAIGLLCGLLIGGPVIRWIQKLT